MKGQSAALFALLSACTLDAGHGFATVEEAALNARFEPGVARDLGMHTVLTNLGYRVRIDAFEADVTQLQLLELRGGSSGVRFDPANPPTGYTLCHGGHCHATDGRLVDYADIEAELAGGAATFASVLTLPIDATVDLRAGASTEPMLAEAARELPEARVTKLALGVTALRIRGEVAGGPAMGGLGTSSVPVELMLAVGEVSSGVEWQIDRDSGGPTRLTFEWRVAGTLFDDVAFAALVHEGRVAIVDPASTEGDLVRAALGESDLTMVRE